MMFKLLQRVFRASVFLLPLVLLGAGCSSIPASKQELPVTSTVGRQSPKVIFLPKSPTSTVTGTQKILTKTNFDIKIKGFSFQPRGISVRVGATITWTNLDMAPHSITADDGTFDSGLISSDKVYSRTFDKPGIFHYHCTLHPAMLGTVIVLE